MKAERTEQLEALETLAEYNDRIIKNIPILVKELNGARLEDTDKFLNGIIQAINWEMQVVNLTMDVLNGGRERVCKERVNARIKELSEAVVSGDDERMKVAFEGIMPILENLKEAVREVLA